VNLVICAEKPVAALDRNKRQHSTLRQSSS